MVELCIIIGQSRSRSTTQYFVEHNAGGVRTCLIPNLLDLARDKPRSFERTPLVIVSLVGVL